MIDYPEDFTARLTLSHRFGKSATHFTPKRGAPVALHDRICEDHARARSGSGPTLRTPVCTAVLSHQSRPPHSVAARQCCWKLSHCCTACSSSGAPACSRAPEACAREALHTHLGQLATPQHSPQRPKQHVVFVLHTTHVTAYGAYALHT